MLTSLENMVVWFLTVSGFDELPIQSRSHREQWKETNEMADLFTYPWLGTRRPKNLNMFTIKGFEVKNTCTGGHLKQRFNNLP